MPERDHSRRDGFAATAQQEMRSRSCKILAAAFSPIMTDGAFVDGKRVLPHAACANRVIGRAAVVSLDVV